MPAEPSPPAASIPELTVPEPDDPGTLSDQGGATVDWPEAPWKAGVCLKITQGFQGPSHTALSAGGLYPVDLDDGCFQPGNTAFMCPYAECRIHLPCRSGAGWGNNLCIEDVGSRSWMFLGHLDAFAPGIVKDAVVRTLTPLATMGNTGSVMGSPGCAGNGTHLHLELGAAGSPVGGRSIAPQTWSVTSGSVCSTLKGAVPSSIRVIAPNGGEVLLKGTPSMVRWTSAGVPGRLRVVAIRAGGELMPPLSTTAPAEGALPFDPPTDWPDGADYRMCVTTPDGKVTDCSDSPFTIRSQVRAGLSVLAPNGGERLERGRLYNFQFTSVGVGGPLRAVVTRRGQEMPPPLSTTAPPMGALGFIAPIDWPDADDYHFCVSANGGALADCSDGPFSIVTRTGAAGSGGGSGTGGATGGGGSAGTGTGGGVGTAGSGGGSGGTTGTGGAGGAVDPPPVEATDGPPPDVSTADRQDTSATGGDSGASMTCGDQDLLARAGPLFQRNDDGGQTRPYRPGELISPVMFKDQVIYVLGPLPPGPLRFCVGYEVDLSAPPPISSMFLATAILRNSPPWDDRFRHERSVPQSGSFAECFQVPAQAQPAAQTQVTALRSWSSGGAFRVVFASLCPN